jgi:hypothetical protein
MAPPVPTVAGPRPLPCLPRALPPSAIASCGHEGSTRPMSSPFLTFVFRSRPASASRAVPTPPATPLPDCRLLDLHPAPVHLCDPSNSSPDIPSDPSPPLLPARRAPPWIASTVKPRPPQLLQFRFLHSGVAPSPLSHRPQTSGSPESAGSAAQ